MYRTKEKKVVLHMVAALENGGAERQLIELLKINTHHILFTFTTTGIYQETLEKYNIKFGQKYSIDRIINYAMCTLILILDLHHNCHYDLQ